ncbi:E3 ubiquitin/ISG15 ligase TRIM25 [Hoplias malabaricus]|uniref:E3 ubiquitin/ISG15 ligase TRIM25 n=1 Tax=Hoplias malabaricus TaxID=27720 RepID=UPI0034627D6C
MAMAVEDTSVLEEELTCPVCLDLYRDPRLLPCGHNFCLQCLRRLKSRSERGRLRCPECRQSHKCSSPWQKNFKLANIADGFRRRGRAEQPTCGLKSTHQKMEGVRCDYCSPEAADSSRGFIAVKTCLKCEVSMCSEHVRPHLELPAFREHPLVEPLQDMRKRKCTEHEEMFRYYCVDDDTFLCNACTIERHHTGHCIKTLKNAMKDMRASLDMQLQKTERRMRKVEKNLQDQNEVELQSKSYMEEAEEQLDVVRGRLKTQLERFFSSLFESVCSHEAERTHSVQQNLTRITEDRCRLEDVHTGIERLLHEHDPFQFIQEYKLCARRYRRLLRKPLFLADSQHRDTDYLETTMEEQMKELLTDMEQQIISFINHLCADDEGVEDEDDGEENNEDGSEEDVEEEEEMRSEGEEEQDISESTDEDYSPEDDEEEDEDE